jgi:hypothetical protein
LDCSVPESPLKESSRVIYNSKSGVLAFKFITFAQPHVNRKEAVLGNGKESVARKTKGRKGKGMEEKEGKEDGEEDGGDVSRYIFRTFLFSG